MYLICSECRGCSVQVQRSIGTPQVLNWPWHRQRLQYIQFLSHHFIWHVISPCSLILQEILSYCYSGNSTQAKHLWRKYFEMTRKRDKEWVRTGVHFWCKRHWCCHTHVTSRALIGLTNKMILVILEVGENLIDYRCIKCSPHVASLPGQEWMIGLGAIT